MRADGPRLDGGATSAGTEEGDLALLYRGRYESSLGAIQSSCGFPYGQMRRRFGCRQNHYGGLI